MADNAGGLDIPSRLSDHRVALGYDAAEMGDGRNPSLPGKFVVMLGIRRPLTPVRQSERRGPGETGRRGGDEGSGRGVREGTQLQDDGRSWR